MITVTRLNGSRITLNALLIETIEETPDTVISLTTGKKIMVLEKVPDVVSLVQTYLQQIGTLGGSIKSVESEGF
ncbi:MAG: flagellar FlbD family protein [Paenibacillaceae bacterium]|uniref:flagellar FlbD family protein n=1 Tax=Paenibacillus cymbidii TaxID=1639034 RepID=UPI001081BD5A|nr:flagellar FlbD family protein [Paenibacillus cymbidii]MBO9609169.1 flagellar FlbD family protein [Paenibacillaceae bacterium]